MKIFINIVIILNISLNLTILPSLVGLDTKQVACFALCVLNLLALAILTNGHRNHYISTNMTMKLFLAVLIWEVLKTPFILGEDRFLLSITIFIYQITFLFILLISFKKLYKSTGAITLSYEFFSIYILFVTILSWILLKLTIVSLGHPVHYFIMNGNIEDGTTYYFPYKLAVYANSSLRFAFAHEYGIPCGLSHEPHVSTFLITPGVFFFLSNNKNIKINALILLSYICFVFLTVSFSLYVLLKFCLYYIISKRSSLCILYSLYYSIIWVYIICQY